MLKSFLTAAALFLSATLGLHHAPFALQTAAVASAPITTTVQSPPPAQTEQKNPEKVISQTQQTASVDASVTDSANRGIPTIAPPVFSSPAVSDFVTSGDLATQLQSLNDKIQSQIAAFTSTPNSTVATGGYTNEIAATNDIDQLSGTTLNNVTVSGISGLTAAEIPDLSSTYLPLGGGTISTNLSVSGTASTSNLVISNSFTLPSSFSGVLHAVAGVVSASLVNLASDVTGILPVGNGGTGWSNITAGAIPYGNGSGALATTSAGTAGQVLALLNGVPTWTATTTLSTISGTLAVNQGGTAATTFGQGWIYSNGGTGALAASTSPTVNYIVATSTTATSTFAGSLSVAGNLNFNGAFLQNGSPFVGSQWTTSGSNISYTAGNVGIGTTSPTAILTLDSSSPNGTIMRVSNGSTGGHIYDWLSTGSASTGGAGRLDLFDYTAGAARLSIASTGNVGVGTTTPGSLFSVAGIGNWTTATSTYYSTGGINLAAGCFSIKGTCITGGGGSGLTGSIGQVSYFSGTNNAVGTSTLTISPASYVGISAASPLAPLQVGNGSVNNSVDAQILISRNVDSTVSGNGHAFSDSSVVTRTGTIGYNSYDARVDIEGTTNYDHYAAFQAAPSFSFIGTMNNYYGLFSDPALNSGTITTAEGLYSGLAGSGATVGTYYGAFIDNVTTAAANYGLFVNGSPNYGTLVSPATDNISIMPGNRAAGQTAADVGINTVTPAAQLDVFEAGVPGEIIQVDQSGGSRSAGFGIDSNGSYYGAALYNNAAETAVFENGGMLLGSSYMTANAPLNGAVIQGNVGIGTSSPDTLLTVGSATPSGNVAHFENSTGSCYINPTTTSLSCSSDARLKKNIAAIDASSTLAGVLALQPVSYNWNSEATGTPSHTGFIAQAVQQIFPDLVSQGPDGYYTLNYAGFAPYLTEAIQQIAAVSDTFQANLIAWLGNADNGIQDLFANNLHAQNELCIGTTCIDQQQLASLLASQKAGQGSGSSDDQATSTPDTPPVIEINGDNPAYVQVGATYNDLGATITGPQPDLDLGITTYLNGLLVSPIAIDTTQPATDTIDYVATDSTGLSATSTRTVFIQAADNGGGAATSTP